MERMLYEAAMEGSVASLQQLLQQDRLILDRVIVDCITETPLHVAAMLGHTDFVKEILCLKPELARELDSRGFSPLHLASAKGYTELVKALLLVDPDMCFACDRYGRNPLHLAAMKGRFDVLKELVRARPHAARARVERGETILHLCVKQNQLEALKFLVETMDDHNDLVNTRDNNGFTILHLAVADKQIETVNYLLSNTRVEVNALNTNVGDLDIGEALRGTGAMRAMNTHLPNHHPQVLQLTSEGDRSVKSKGKEHWLTRKRDALMVVASLIATMAFQAAVNPPGGAWQDNSTQNSQDTQAGKSHAAGTGKAIMADITTQRVSLSIILMLITGLPFTHRLFMWMLTVVVWVAITSMALTYRTAMAFLTPGSAEAAVTNIIVVGVAVWCGVMALVLVGHTIRLLVASFRKLGKLCWRERRLQSSLVYANHTNISF
ncbi:hypothetical protein AAG906_002506 [Vitis piasezkii]